jgi:3-hydroxyacyl-CoA dehydrogenase/enoyl-CoA hydratase/3-hydroxybutyryl-CoA epimerase
VSHEGSGSLRVERRDAGVAVLVFDVPGESTNTLRAGFDEELEQVLGALEADESIRALVFTSGKSDGFIAGADVRRLAELTSAEEGTLLCRRGQRALERLAGLRFPVVSAIHGACLGGGLELALATTERVASSASSTKLGLPEVQLGILPGLGGTQRLPRLVGLSAALDLLLSGRQLDARRAAALGLVDEVVAPSLLDSVAVARALSLASGGERPGRQRALLDPSVLRERALAENALGRMVVFDQARRRLREKTHGNYPAPERILDVVRRGLEAGLRAGLEAEAEAFGELVVTPEARALRHVFFGQQAAKKETGVAREVEPRAVSAVGVLGAGLMGAGIAYVSVTAAGARVRLKDVSAEALQGGLRYADELLAGRAGSGRISAWEREQLLARITRSTDYSGFSRLDLVIEAVFEDLELKRRVLSQAEEAIAPQAIFASNTSALSIASIAEGARHPERVLGMHYFSPVEKMPLLEVVVTEATADFATRTAVQFGKRQGKTVIVVRDAPGFFTSRVLGAYLNEAAHLVLEGGAVEALDQALVAAGFPVGPLELLDEVGFDVAAKVGQTLAAAYGARLAPPAAFGALVEGGRRGRKARRGFYRYDGKPGGARPVDAAVYGELGLEPPPRAARPEALELAVERCLLTLVNESVRCLGEGVLRSARDGDLGAVLGLGFPPFLGGPLYYAEAVGVRALLERLRRLEGRFGARFEPAPLLLEASLSGRSFDELRAGTGR